MKTSRARSGARILGLALAALAIAAPAAWADDDDDDRRSKKDVNVQLLGLNDFHGALEPPTGSGGRVGNVDPAASSTSPPTSGRSSTASRTASWCPQAT
jgi:5'-nucleotidase